MEPGVGAEALGDARPRLLELVRARVAERFGTDAWLHV